MSRNRSSGSINGRDLARLVRRVAEKFGQDRIPAESARIAFYFFLSLFPFLLILFSLTGMLGREAAFRRVIEARPATVHLIITGRGAPEFLIEAADLVTEMREIKHPYTAGLLAQPGIDY